MKQRLVGFASADNSTYIFLCFLAETVKKWKSSLTAVITAGARNATSSTFNPDSAAVRRPIRAGNALHYHDSDALFGLAVKAKSTL